MIIGVITSIGCAGYKTTTNNAPGAPASFTWSFDGVFAVVAAIFDGKDFFPVPKHRAVLVVLERPSLVNQPDHVATLLWQGADRNGADVGSRYWCFRMNTSRAETQA